MNAIQTGENSFLNCPTVNKKLGQRFQSAPHHVRMRFEWHSPFKLTIKLYTCLLSYDFLHNDKIPRYPLTLISEQHG